MVDISHSILMIVVWKVKLKNFIDKIKRINGLEKLEVLASIQLPYISFRGIEQHALFEFFRPYQLYLCKELLPFCVSTSDIDDIKSFQWRIRHLIIRNIFYVLDLIIIIKRQKGIEQTDDKIRMLSEDSIKS